MSLEKGIKSGKEKRKPYRRSKVFDSDCKNHGSCGWCRDNRLYQYRKELERVKFEEKDLEQEWMWYAKDWNWSAYFYWLD